MKGLSLNFAALRSVLEGDTGDGVTQRVERWALRRLSGVLQIETLWRFNAKYEPKWLPRYIVFDSAEQFVPVVVQIMRAESLTEVPVIGRLLTTGVAKRSGPAVPEEVLAAQEHAGNGAAQPAGGRDGGAAAVSEPRCPRCGHPGVHAGRGDGGRARDATGAGPTSSGAIARPTTSRSRVRDDPALWRAASDRGGQGNRERSLMR